MVHLVNQHHEELGKIKLLHSEKCKVKSRVEVWLGRKKITDMKPTKIKNKQTKNPIKYHNNNKHTQEVYIEFLQKLRFWLRLAKSLSHTVQMGV